FMAISFLLVLGFIVRIVQYWSNRSIWLDESTIALNVVHKSYLQLLHQLDYDQSAPVGFLWLEKLAVQIFGNSEQALRLFPLLVSLLSLVLFSQIATKLLSKRGVIISLILFVFCESLTYYASEVKQYSFDVFASLLIIYFYLKFSSSNGLISLFLV